MSLQTLGRKDRAEGKPELEERRHQSEDDVQAEIESERRPGQSKDRSVEEAEVDSRLRDGMGVALREHTRLQTHPGPQKALNCFLEEDISLFVGMQCSRMK